MLKSHLDIREDLLLRIAKIPSISGHPLHKGLPREVFVKEFLAEHLGENIAIGSGEIIDAQSRPGEARNQVDIVIYRKDYPKLHFGGDSHAFLVESVIATIEVKSKITKERLRKCIKSAYNIKSLERNLLTPSANEYTPPHVINYVVAYDGPTKMNDNIRTVIIAPMTTKSRAYPTRIPCIFEKRDAYIVLDQIRTVDQQRLIKRLGKIDRETQYAVLDALAELFAE